MTVYFNKRRRRWMSNFVRRGKRHSSVLVDKTGSPVTSRRAAVEAEAEQKRRADSDHVIAAATGVTLAEIVSKLKKEWKLHARWPQFKRYVREMLQFFGPDALISDVNDDSIAEYRSYLRTTPVIRWVGGPKRDSEDPRYASYWVQTGQLKAPATVNLYLEPLRQCLQRATTMRDPFDRPVLAVAPKVKRVKCAKRKARPIPDHILIDVILSMPPHVVDAINMTLCFGFRKGEALSLRRNQVDFVRGGVQLLAENVKDNEDEFLPGSQFAMGYLRCLDMEAEERGVQHLITWRKPRKDPAAQAKEQWRPLKDPHYAWRRAQAIMKAKTGRKWRWHDMRAAYISHVALKSGLLQAQSLARHSDIKTTMMYMDVDDQIRQVAAEEASQRPFFEAVSQTPTNMLPTQQK